MVTATDPGRRRVRDDFVVRVVAGKRSNPDSINVRSAPVPVGSIPDQALTIVGSAVRFDVAPFFVEPDGDAVIYSARLATEAERIPDSRIRGYVGQHAHADAWHDIGQH